MVYQAKLLRSALLGLVSFFLFASFAIADERLRRSPALFSGIPAEQLRTRFGEPDTREHRDEQQTETWRYGSSFFLLSDGRLVGWHDDGELSLRESERDVSTRLALGKTRARSYRWVDAWTLRSEISRASIIDSLLPVDSDGGDAAASLLLGK